MSDHFADRIILRQRELGHPLCVGLDPHLERIPALFRRGSMGPRDPRTAEVVENFLKAVLERLEGRVAVVKPQIAFFELLGWHGLRALEAVIAAARQSGLAVVLDAKRGDIGSTAVSYADAYLDPDSALAVDAITLNPYLGRDSLTPFLDRARQGERGLFVLVKTSNPGSGDFQDRFLGESATLFETVASALAESALELRGPATGWSSLGAVVGANYPGPGERVRELLPHSIFLVPGYGAQGGSAEDAVRGFVPGPDGRLEGGLVSSSRGILFPAGSDTADAHAWEAAIDAGVERAIGELTRAVAG